MGCKLLSCLDEILWKVLKFFNQTDEELIYYDLTFNLWTFLKCRIIQEIIPVKLKDKEHGRNQKHESVHLWCEWGLFLVTIVCLIFHTSINYVHFVFISFWLLRKVWAKCHLTLCWSPVLAALLSSYDLSWLQSDNFF